MTTQLPKDARYFLNGSYYKIGLRNMTFVWAGDEWIRSAKSVSSVKGGEDIAASHSKRMNGGLDARG